MCLDLVCRLCSTNATRLRTWSPPELASPARQDSLCWSCRRNYPRLVLSTVVPRALLSPRIWPICPGWGYGARVHSFQPFSTSSRLWREGQLLKHYSSVCFMYFYIPLSRLQACNKVIQFLLCYIIIITR